MQKTLLPIQAVARKLEIPEKYFEQWGSQSGKVKLELLSDPAFKPRGELVVVTATTPTAAGEGKTVTSISLTQGLAHIGKKVVITSREPSLGPVFGMKGGAAGGGLSQIEPSAKIISIFTAIFTPSPRPTICSPLSSMRIFSTATSYVSIPSASLGRAPST